MQPLLFWNLQFLWGNWIISTWKSQKRATKQHCCFEIIAFSVLVCKELFFKTFFCIIYIYLCSSCFFLFWFFDYSGHTICAPIITLIFLFIPIHLQKHCSQGIDLARTVCLRERMIYQAVKSTLYNIYTFHFKRHLNVIETLIIKPRKQPLITLWTQS